MSQITILDLNFQGVPNSIAAFLVETSAGPILVETGPHSCQPYLEAGLAEKGYHAEDIGHVFLTHIHLDHAGSAWTFAEKGAKVYVHPKGHRHLASPEKLMASATMIYGDQMETLWGQMRAIDDPQLVQVKDRETIKIGDTDFIAHHTPGHAKHHVAWQMGDSLFTGDVAGVKIDGGPVMPPCPPPDIDIEDWMESIGRIKEISPNSLLLTHFGEVVDISDHVVELERILLDWAQWIKPYFDKDIEPDVITPKFQAYVREQLTNAAVDVMGLDQYDKANPAWMSVAGLMRYWKLKMAAQKQ